MEEMGIYEGNPNDYFLYEKIRNYATVEEYL